MIKTLGGSLFVRNGLQYDYCFHESINCLLEFCDKVCVVDVGSDDGTTEVLKSMSNKKLDILFLDKQEWELQTGYQKLTYFTDKAIERLDTDYNFYLQADEILHERSYNWVRTSLEEGAEGYICRRINLWQSPYLRLDVQGRRNPCSTGVLRLAKTCYRAYGDAESLAAPCISDYIDHIRIYHMGFVRKREVMKSKIINMQEGVFALGSHDEKLDQCEVFNPKLWFGNEDLKPIDEPLPLIIQDWASKRVYED